MLQLNTKIKHQLRNFFTIGRGLQFSPQRVSSDELIQEIDEQYTSADRNWHLEPHPDVRQLDEFWTRVQQDLHADPTWNRFTD